MASPTIVGALGAAVGSFVGFSLGVFPMESLNRLLRRLTSRALNVAEEKENNDQLIAMLGVTPNVAAQLNGEGVESVQQLADVDPVSLALRAGLSFDYILNLASQFQAWSFIGKTAGELAPLGLGDARAIAKLVDLYAQGDHNAKATLLAAADEVKVNVELLLFNFKNIATDRYTKFLLQATK
jgi:hypothetical protein